MAAQQVGRILLIPRGDYNSGTMYNSLDWVRHSGAVWVCKVDGTQGVEPTLSATANWALMVEDGTVGGWSTLANKPFETVGAGLDVDTLDPNKPLYVDCTGTVTVGDTDPISGGTVYSHLTSNYYDKTYIDNEEKTLVKYGGSVTFGDLIANASTTYLKADKINTFYMLTDEGSITNTNRGYFAPGLPVGTHFPKDSHLAVIEVVEGGVTSYKYDEYGGGVEGAEVYYEITDNLTTYTFNTTNFPNNAITANSVIDVYSNIVGDKYSNITVGAGICTVVCPVQQTRTLRIYVR